MHGSIKDRLEQLLSARGAEVSAKFRSRVASEVNMREAQQHLSDCTECFSELAEMHAQADLFAVLRSPSDLEPAPGFYSRVLQRIEERTKDSIWSVFVDSSVSKRLVYASLTIAFALGTYVVTEETRDGRLNVQAAVTQSVHDDAVVEGDQAEQRDLVLANFATHSALSTGNNVSVRPAVVVQ